MTTRKIGVAALLGALALGAFSVTARAQNPCVAPVLIKFDADVFAYETVYNTNTYMSSAGSDLTVVGKIVCFGPPLDYLYANIVNNSAEYTFIWTLKTLQAPFPAPLGAGTVQTIANRVWDTDYASVAQPGTFVIYEDTTPDAPNATNIPVDPLNPLNLDVPEKFVDGTPILSGVIDYFHTQITRTSTGRFSGSFNANYHFTSGSLFSLIGGNSSNLNGLWCSLGTGTQQCMVPSNYTLWPTTPSGYSAHANGKNDSPTIAYQSTWGAIKLLYR